MRKISFKILYDVFFNNELLNNALNKYFDNEKNVIKEIDKSFIKREVSGVIENLDDIDDLINKYSKVKTKKLNKDILIVLRLGFYEMTYMDKVPIYAVINEYVNIIKKSKSAKLSGYVNAVLRNYSKDCDINKSSINDKIKNCYFRIYNHEKDAVLDELENKSIDYKEYEGDLLYKYANVYKVNKYKDILESQSFADGNILISDASSIYMTDKLAKIITNIFKDEKDISILDTCASPGGKVLGVIDLLGDDFLINAVACDISDEKIIKIKDNIERLRLSDKKNVVIRTCIRDASKLESGSVEKFDVVICDVPCSGLGVIEKKPDIRLNFSEEKKAALVNLQRNILDVSKKYLKSGGILSYSTCTETSEENKLNIKYFLDNNKNFKVLYEKQILSGDSNNSDGFYMCFMVKD